MKKLFGTDGIRGIANKDLTPELAFKVGVGAALVLGREKGKILIGKDTRYSGDLIEAALAAGIASMGHDVVKLGIIPTPAVSYLTKKHKALGGVVVSASHNPGEYNGIKFFNASGLKLTDEMELEIEKKIADGIMDRDRPIKDGLGRITYLHNSQDEYIEYLKEIMDLDLRGFKVALDCGNGALYKIAPRILRELGAEVVAINTEPNGLNINENCGSTNPGMIQELVVDTKSHMGLSFDGDGDRIIAADELGNLIDGDHILAILGNYMSQKGELRGNTVVGTIMTNMGLDDYLSSIGLDIVKTQVGDRYILEEMDKKGYSLGGEQSGHIIMMDYNTTGDGLATGLKLLKVSKDLDKPVSQLNKLMKDYPQVLINARVREELKHKYGDYDEILREIELVENKFHGRGRVIIRPSGTEPLIRVMIEALEGNIEEEAVKLAKFIEEKLG